MRRGLQTIVRWGRAAKVELAVGATAVVLAVVLTRHGVLIDPDSPTYLFTARLFQADPTRIASLPEGTSLSVRGLFPPLYPIVLAAIGWGDDITAARVLGALLAGLSAALLVHIVRRDASTATALVVAALVLLSRGYLLVTFGFLMAEGLYTALALLAVAIVSHGLASSARLRTTALAAGAAAGAAFATRYVGLGVVIGISLALGLVVDAPRRARARAAATALVIGLVPVLVWSALLARSGTTGPRHLGWRGFDGGDLWFFDTIPASHLPRQVIDALGYHGNRAVGVAVVGAAVAWSATALWRATRPGSARAARAVGALVLVGWGHLGVLATTRLVVDRQIPLGGRHTMLWFTCLVAGAGIDAHRWLTAGAPRWARPAVAALAAALVLGSLPAFGRSVSAPKDSWWNLSQVPPSDLIAVIDDLPDDLVIYTDREDRVYLETGQPTARLPEPRDRYTEDPNPAFGRQLAEVGDEARAGRAVIAAFIDGRALIAPEADLVANSGLVVVARTNDGVLLAPPGFTP